LKNKVFRTGSYLIWVNLLHFMDLTMRCGYHCTPEGIALLDSCPGFISDVLLNETHREFWLVKDGGTRYENIFTKIIHGNEVYLEKKGQKTDYRDPIKYGRLASELEDFSHIKPGVTYFGNEDSIVMRFYPHEFERPNLSSGDFDMDVLDEYWKFEMMCIPGDVRTDEEGNLFVIDPHC